MFWIIFVLNFTGHKRNRALGTKEEQTQCDKYVVTNFDLGYSEIGKLLTRGVAGLNLRMAFRVLVIYLFLEIL